MAKKTYYHYATNKDGSLVHVKKAIKGEPYYCSECGAEMIPKQGSIREWHFAHKCNEYSCSYESYLHRLAKTKIKEWFDESENIFIEYYANTFCCKRSSCKWVIDGWIEKDMCQLDDEYQQFDLKKYYDVCCLEIYDNEYRPDLCLKSTTNPNRESLWIEIKVSHGCSEDKLRCGNRIIEINIDSEEDINAIINSNSLIETKTSDGWRDDYKIRFYNFRELAKSPEPMARVVDNDTYWYKKIYKYKLFKSMKSYTEMIDCRGTDEKNVGSKPLYELLSNQELRYKLRLGLIWMYDKQIRHCALCKYGKVDEYVWSGREENMPYFCKGYVKFGLQTTGDGFRAMDCGYFSVDNVNLEKYINEEINNGLMFKVIKN